VEAFPLGEVLEERYFSWEEMAFQREVVLKYLAAKLFLVLVGTYIFKVVRAFLEQADQFKYCLQLAQQGFQVVLSKFLLVNLTTVPVVYC